MTPIVGPMGIIELAPAVVNHALAVTERHPGVRLYAYPPLGERVNVARAKRNCAPIPAIRKLEMHIPGSVWRAVTRDVPAFNVTRGFDEPYVEHITEQEQRDILRSNPLLKPRAAELAKAYQAKVLCYALHHQLLIEMACGAGKTLATVLRVAQYLQRRNAGPVAIIVPAKAQVEWVKCFREWTSLTPFAVRPKKQMRKLDPTMEDYRSTDLPHPPIIIWRRELLGDFLEDILAFRPEHIVVDEAHGFGHKRWVREVDANGELSFRRSNTAKTEGRTTRASTMDAIVRSNSVQFITFTTATRRSGARSSVWNLLSLLQPSAWGSRSDFCRAYTGGHDGKYGFIPDDPRRVPGARSLELDKRIESVAYAVPHSDSHAELPAVRLTRIDLSSDTAAKQGFTSLKKYTDSCAPGAPVGSDTYAEMLLDHEGSKVRKPVLDRILAELQSGEPTKIIVMAHFRFSVQQWSDYIFKAVKRKKLRVKTFQVDGDSPTKVVREATAAFLQPATSCVCVGTYGKLGESIDGLQSATTVFLVGLPTGESGPRVFTQTIGRVDRHGSSIATEVVVHVCGDKMDRAAHALGERLREYDSANHDRNSSFADTLEGLSEAATTTTISGMLSLFS
jgi:hypothetical protein